MIEKRSFVAIDGRAARVARDARTGISPEPDARSTGEQVIDILMTRSVRPFDGVMDLGDSLREHCVDMGLKADAAMFATSVIFGSGVATILGYGPDPGSPLYVPMLIATGLGTVAGGILSYRESDRAKRHLRLVREYNEAYHAAVMRYFSEDDET